jgi:hypothetical protein
VEESDADAGDRCVSRWVWLACITGQFAAAFPFIICDSLQAIRVGVVGFDLSPVLMLCLMARQKA